MEYSGYAYHSDPEYVSVFSPYDFYALLKTANIRASIIRTQLDYFVEDNYTDCNPAKYDMYVELDKLNKIIKNYELTISELEKYKNEQC